MQHSYLTTDNLSLQDNDVLLQIDKDVRRLCPDLTFFQQATPYPNLVVVGDSTMGIPSQERLHARVTQVSYG